MKKFLGMVIIYSSTKFIFLVVVGVMIAYIMSLPLGLLDVALSLFPTILNWGWRLCLILLCLMLLAIILESVFNSDRQ